MKKFIYDKKVFMGMGKNIKFEVNVDPYFRMQGLLDIFEKSPILFKFKKNNRKKAVILNFAQLLMGRFGLYQTNC